MTTFVTPRLSWVIVLVSCLLIVAARAQSQATPLFDDSAAIDVTLTGPLESVFDDMSDREESPFVLAAEGVEHEIKVRLRGHSRLRVCDFPPLRLNFRTSTTEGTIFAGQDRLKLVTHCRDNERSEQDTLEEYLVYRIFNVLTQTSYRVRLLHIKYVATDTKRDEGVTQRYGFVLEPGRQFAERTGTTPVQLPGVPKHRQEVNHSALVYVFQYLVGNTDWGFVKADYDDGCCHNGDLYERESRVLFVPYDFDLAGLVNAKYAFPDPLLRIDKVTQRLYRGVCTDPEVLRDALAEVMSRQSDILALAQDIPGLSARGVEKARKYLSAFFDKAEDDEKLLKMFERRCI